MAIERYGNSNRISYETQISAEVYLNDSSASEVSTGIGFFDHMLNLLAKHGEFKLGLHCKGDLSVDGHHTVEDTGIVLGKAFDFALGDKKGINRFGYASVPMDDALASVSIDISGRPYLHTSIPVLSSFVGDFDTQLLVEFFRAFSVYSGLTIHIIVPHGINSHHIIEAIFKAFALALKQAVSIDNDKKGWIPSTKGIID